MQRNSNGIAYTTDKQEAERYRVEDARDTTKFIKDEAKRRWIEANGSRIKLYTKVQNYYVLPVCNHKPIQKIKQFSFDIPDITLHEHQNLMVAFVEKIYREGKKSAMVIMGTGVGKTFGMIAVTQLLGLSTVIVTPNSTISKLLYDDFSKYVDTKIIKGSKDIVLGKVNIMCHQTFNRIYDEINGQIEVLLIEENHHIPETRVKQINLRKGRFVCGVTATAIRKEFGLEGFQMLFGDILDTQSEALPIKLYYHDFRYDYNTTEFMNASEGLAPDSPEMYRRLVIENDARHEELVTIIERFRSIGKKYFIVFSDRVDHIINVANHLKKIYANVREYRGDSDKDKVIAEFQSVDNGIIVGNLQACGEGFNIKKLEVGILFVSTQWTVTCEQAAGRVRRKYGDKEHGIFVDFVDNLSFNGSNTKKLGRYERKKIYAKKGRVLNYI